MIFNFYNYIPSKKNSKQIIYNKKTKRRQIISSNHFIDWENVIKNTYKETTIIENNENNENNDLKYYLNKKELYITAIFYKRTDWLTFDLTNEIQSIEDVLQEINIISDDSNKILSNFNYKYIDIKREDDICCIFQISEGEKKITDLLKTISNITIPKKPEEYDIMIKERRRKNSQKKKKQELKRDLDI